MSYQPGLIPFDFEALRAALQEELVQIATEINEARSGNITEISSVKVHNGTGAPEGVVTANVGSLYLRLDGGASTTLYVKESGTNATGWVAK